MNFDQRLKLLNLILKEKELQPLKEWMLKIGFLNQIGSLKHHDSYSGGLFDHSYKVSFLLEDFTIKYNLKWEKDRSPRLIGIGHDLCKWDNFIIDANGHFIKNPKLIDKRHGIRSAEILRKFVPDLTEEEFICVEHHMGFSVPEEQFPIHREALRKYPNAIWVHHADTLAAFIDINIDNLIKERK